MAQNDDSGLIQVDTTDVFTTDEKFDTRDAVVAWAREVGVANKVTIVVTRSDKKNGIRGRYDKLILACDRSGKYDSSESSTTSASKKCNCPFKIRATPSPDGSGWRVQVQCGVHNHGLPDQFAGHPHRARLTAEENKRVEDLTKCHVAPRHIVLDLKAQNPDSLVDAKQIYRKRVQIQKDERGPRTEMQHLLQWLDNAKYVSFNRRREDGSDVVSDIFWAHPDSIKLLNLFPVVLVMDCTYKTNKYRLPLLEIIGITSTDLTFSVGFAYLESEKKDNYQWALEKLKGLFIKQDMFPQVILTDRELALMNAIQSVFPHTVNMLCKWHINKNVGTRLSLHVHKDMREVVKNLWNNVVNSADEVEYEQHLNALQQACVSSSKFFDYVVDTWLNPHKERFVAAWTNRVMHLGNTTTNRVESAHWKLKQELEHSKGDLVKCLDAMNNNIIVNVGNIKSSFQKSFCYTEYLHRSPFYKNLRSFVSRAAMTLISEEFTRVGIVGTDKDICGCTLRKTCQLPCACELGRYTEIGEPIPLDSVHGHWKILTMEGPLEDDTADEYELDITQAMDAIWSRFRSLDIIGKRALKSKLFELAYPTTSSLCPPPEQIKTRGGQKNKGKGKAPKGYDVYRDPSYFEHVEREERESQGTSKRVCTRLSQSSQNQLSQPSSQKQLSQSSQKHPSQSSQKQPSQSSQKQLSQSSQKQPSQKQLSQTAKKLTSQEFLPQFPKHMHSHISDIVDVVPDGNCGFRAIASLLGYTQDGWSMVRRELDNELRGNNSFYEKLFKNNIQVVRDSLQISGLGNQLEDRWFTVPAMGYLVANRYNVVLVTLGKPSTTFFPMTTSYSSSARFFCLGYVGGKHWVQLNMKTGFPLPDVTPDWKKFSSHEATSWMSNLAGRLQYWKLLSPAPVKPPVGVLNVDNY